MARGRLVGLLFSVCFGTLAGWAEPVLFKITLQSQPSGASIRAKGTSNELAKTGQPFTLDADAFDTDIKLEVSSPGYRTANVTIERQDLVQGVVLPKEGPVVLVSNRPPVTWRLSKSWATRHTRAWTNTPSELSPTSY